MPVNFQDLTLLFSLELAKSRLGEFVQRSEWVVSDFRAKPTTVIRPDSFDVVIGGPKTNATWQGGVPKDRKQFY